MNRIRYDLECMQTFLPYPDFAASLSILDRARLGKQRIEAQQILNILHFERTGSWIKQPKRAFDPKKKLPWSNHPATRMWRGYEGALAWYMNQAIYEWCAIRLYRNTMRPCDIYTDVTLPPWFGDEQFHASHRSNLLRKKPQFYSMYGWAEPSDLLYVWPV